VLAGRGTINMNMEWDPALLVSLVCHSFRFQEKLAGDILPFHDELTTRVEYVIRDSSIVGLPRVQRDVVRLPVDLTDASWGKVRAKLVEQDHFSRCGMVMNADSVLAKLQELARRGVKIRLPATMFKPFQLPVVLNNYYKAGEYWIEARAFDPAIEVRPECLRLAFRANLRVIAPPSSAPRALSSRVDPASLGARHARAAPKKVRVQFPGAEVSCPTSCPRDGTSDKDARCLSLCSCSGCAWFRARLLRLVRSHGH